MMMLRLQLKQVLPNSLRHRPAWTLVGNTCRTCTSARVWSCNRTTCQMYGCMTVVAHGCEILLHHQAHCTLNTCRMSQHMVLSMYIIVTVNLTYYAMHFLSCFDQHNSRKSGDAEAVCKLLQAAAESRRSDSSAWMRAMLANIERSPCSSPLRPHPLCRTQPASAARSQAAASRGISTSLLVSAASTPVIACETLRHRIFQPTSLYRASRAASFGSNK
jgi:hypothetical protein